MWWDCLSYHDELRFAMQLVFAGMTTEQKLWVTVYFTTFPFPSATVTGDIPESYSGSWNQNGDDKDDLKWTYSMNKKWFILSHWKFELITAALPSLSWLIESVFYFLCTVGIFLIYLLYREVSHLQTKFRFKKN